MMNQSRRGFILLTSVGLSAMIILYGLTILPMKLQTIQLVRAERELLERKQIGVQQRLDLSLQLEK